MRFIEAKKKSKMLKGLFVTSESLKYKTNAQE